MLSSLPHKILILEDSIQDVNLMKSALDNARFNYISKHVDSKNDFLDCLETFKPEIILADYSLSGFNGMHAYHLFRKQKSFIPFILITGVLSEKLASECLSEGVDDFILKSNYSELPFVINRCLELKSAEFHREEISSRLELKDIEIRTLRSKIENDKLHKLLSKREYEIFYLIATGSTIKEIATRLFLSPATVATYRARLLEKLNFKSNIEMVHYAMRNGLIE
ncbi:MAG: LuxR C-terminal-related transcriptional regulator [Bacteroidia bacterium]